MTFIILERTMIFQKRRCLLCINASMSFYVSFDIFNKRKVIKKSKLLKDIDSLYFIIDRVNHIDIKQNKVL